MPKQLVALAEAWGSMLGRILALMLVAVLLMGCLDVDVAIDFKDANHGQITERITVSDRLLAEMPDALQDWAIQVRRQVNPMGGTSRAADGALVVAVPFYNSRDLQGRFNRLLAVPGYAEPVQLTATRDLNLIVSQRNRLSLDVDLRSLQQLDMGRLRLRLLNRAVAGRLQLSAPSPITVLSASSPVTATEPNVVSWEIVPDQPNHLELTFWVPSPLGIGAVLIGVLMVASALLRPMFPL